MGECKILTRSDSGVDDPRADGEETQVGALELRSVFRDRHVQGGLRYRIRGGNGDSEGRRHVRIGHAGRKRDHLDH